VRIHGVLVAGVVVAPDVVQELPSRVHPSGVPGEMMQQLEFLCGQIDRSIAEGDGALVRIDDHPSGLQDQLRFGEVVSDRVHAPEYRLDPR